MTGKMQFSKNTLTLLATENLTADCMLHPQSRQKAGSSDFTSTLMRPDVERISRNWIA